MSNLNHYICTALWKYTIHMVHFTRKKSFYNACSAGDISRVKYTFTHKNITRNELNDGLTYACSFGHVQMVKYLTHRGATNFDYALFVASSNEHLPLIKYMIYRGANGFQVLHWAYEYCRSYIVIYLVDYGSIDYNTGLTFACDLDDDTLISHMIEGGATHCTNCNNTRHTYKK